MGRRNEQVGMRLAETVRQVSNRYLASSALSGTLALGVFGRHYVAESSARTVGLNEARARLQVTVALHDK